MLLMCLVSSSSIFSRHAIGTLLMLSHNIMNFKIKMKEDFCVLFSDFVLGLVKNSTIKGTFIDDNEFICQPNLNGLCFMDEDKVLLKYSWLIFKEDFIK
jgi:hypothetical protein